MTKVAAEDPSFAVKVRCQRLIFYKKTDSVREAQLSFILFLFFLIGGLNYLF